MCVHVYSYMSMHVAASNNRETIGMICTGIGMYVGVYVGMCASV